MTGLTQDRLTRSNSPVQIWLSSPLNHSASPFLSHANQVQYLYCKTRYDALNCFFFTIFPKCYFKNNSRQDKSGATPENINKFYFLNLASLHAESFAGRPLVNTERQELRIKMKQRRVRISKVFVVSCRCFQGVYLSYTDSLMDILHDGKKELIMV